MDNNLPIDDNQKPETPEETPSTTPTLVIEETPPITLPEEPKQETPEPTIEIGSLGQPSLSTFQNVSGKTNNKSKKIKSVVSILGLLLIIVSLPLTVVLVKQRQEIRKEAQMSPIVTTEGIQNTPIGETLPTTANGGTYSTSFRITNTTSGSRTAVLEKKICACPEGAGNPPGLCHNCSTSNETVTLSSGQSIERTLSAHQSSGTVCGSFQLDITVLSVQ
jgi:hypothetical protein